jgi:hypothetical protein
MRYGVYNLEAGDGGADSLILLPVSSVVVSVFCLSCSCREAIRIRLVFRLRDGSTAARPTKPGRSKGHANELQRNSTPVRSKSPRSAESWGTLLN